MKNKAVRLLSVLTLCCMILLLALAVLAPWLIRIYADFRRISQESSTAILIAFYACFLPSLIALLCLFRLLRNIRRERVFDDVNSALMAVISWCCMGAAAATLAAAYWYFPLLLITASMLFLFLTVRVVRNCFIAAIEVQRENSLTI